MAGDFYVLKFLQFRVDEKVLEAWNHRFHVANYGTAKYEIAKTKQNAIK